jgi:tRNA pseudouridine55 synthase
MNGRDGILLVDKPQGMTSHDVVDFIRKRFRIKKVGHGGTLDPQATGVLVILLGRATKLFPEVIELEKEYIGSFYLGRATDTGDTAGKIILEETNPDRIKSVGKDRIKEVFLSLIGEFPQTPPMFSALHYKGRRLYELAREGKTVYRRPRRVRVSSLELLDLRLPFVDFSIVCYRGTYIRSLCDEINRQLDIPVHLYSLRRQRCGNFCLENAFSLDKLRDGFSLEEFIRPALIP